MSPNISSVVFQFPLENLLGITRLSVFLLCQHCSISCSATCPLEPIYYRRDYLCLFDIRINQSYFEDLVKLEDEELMFYLILKLVLYFSFSILMICLVYYIFMRYTYIIHVYCICTLYILHVLYAYYVYTVHVYSVYSIYCLRTVYYAVCTWQYTVCMHICSI